LGLTFNFEPFLLVHPLNGTCILNTTSAPNYILHIRRMGDKINGLNILITNVTNLIVIYLQLLIIFIIYYPNLLINYTNY
jgi:hypothetical protein